MLSRIIRDGDITPALKSHVNAEWFTEPEDARVWGFLQQHYSKHGEVPSKVLVGASFPTYRVLDPVDSLEPLLEEFRKRRKAGLTTVVLMEAVELVETHKDHDAALERMVRGTAEITAEVSTTSDIDLVDTYEDRIQHYDDIRGTGGLIGIPTGFPTMDEATGGLQPEQLVCVVATPKAGKSTLMMRMALTNSQDGHLPLFLSFEMSALEQAMRFDAFRAGIDHHKLQRGLLTPEDRALLVAAGAAARRKGHGFLMTEDIAATTTVSGIAAKVEEHNPSVVYIDAVYLMHDELGEDPGSPQALTNITRNLKRLAQRTKTPFVMSTQALISKVRKREGIAADSIGYSSSFFQDSDALFGLQEDPDDDGSRKLRLINARNAGKREVMLEWNWKNSTFRERDVAFSPADYDGDE